MCSAVISAAVLPGLRRMRGTAEKNMEPVLDSNSASFSSSMSSKPCEDSQEPEDKS